MDVKNYDFLTKIVDMGKKVGAGAPKPRRTRSDVDRRLRRAVSEMKSKGWGPTVAAKVHKLHNYTLQKAILRASIADHGEDGRLDTRLVSSGTPGRPGYLTDEDPAACKIYMTSVASLRLPIDRSRLSAVAHRMRRARFPDAPPPCRNTLIAIAKRAGIVFKAYRNATEGDLRARKSHECYINGFFDNGEKFIFERSIPPSFV